MAKSLFFFIILVLCSLSVISQNNKPMRIEVEDNKTDEVYSLALKNKYFILLEHQRKRAPKGEHWIVEIFDQQLKKSGNKEFFLPREFRLFSHKLEGDSVVWICFAEPDGNNASLMLYRINLKTGFMVHAYLKGSRKARLVGIEVLNNKLVVIGESLEDIQEQINMLKLPAGIEIVAPSFPEYAHILASKAIANNVVVMVNFYKGSETGLFYFEYSGLTTNLISNKLSEADKINLIDGSLIETSVGELLFMGTYNKDMGKQPSKEQIIALGTYIGKIRNQQFDFFKTNEFSEFVNIFSTLNYNEQLKAKQKVSKGKDVNLGFKLLIHEKSIKQGDLYVLVAESYYPEYHYENNFDSRGYMYQMEVFDGYRTTNCMVAAFNAQGRLIWDNYMHVSDVRDYTLQENILVFPEADSSIVMAYYSREEINSKAVKGSEVVYKKSSDKVETVYGENIISEESGRIDAWYDNYFILSGHQIVIGKDSKKRKVFYFNLISFE